MLGDDKVLISEALKAILTKKLDATIHGYPKEEARVLSTLPEGDLCKWHELWVVQIA